MYGAATSTLALYDDGAASALTFQYFVDEVDPEPAAGEARARA